MDLTKAATSVALLAEGERYRMLIDSITDHAVYMLDRDGRVTTWNTGAERITGFTRSQMIGQHFACLHVPEDREAGKPQQALAAAEGGKFETEAWGLRRDGSRMWTRVALEPIRGAQGELAGYAATTRELGERKASQTALLRSEEQFRLLVEGVTDYAIYMLDPEGHIVSWNPGAQRIKGYAPQEIIGEHFSRFYLEAERQRGEPERGLEAAAREGRFEKEGWRVRKDGTSFWASVVIDAIRNEAGELIGFAKVTRDVTEKRRAQHALDEAREALFQAQKVEAIGQLTGGVAHDFNNLLTVVLGSLELLRKRMPGDGRLLSLVDNAAQAAQRGASLTQRMLAFARRQELDPQPIDIAALVHGMSELLQRSLGPSIRIETRFPDVLPRILSDANQLEAALLNLGVNARDAMPRGGVIVISACEDDTARARNKQLGDGRYIRFSVQDDGEGMDQATLERATDPFFTTKGVGKGTGLGLSMVQGLAEQSGGCLALTSRKGEGTTVDMWLPVAAGEAAQAPDVKPEAKTEPTSPRTLRVLAVDDDALVLMNTVAMIEDMGHAAIEAISGDEALRHIRDGAEVDLVITDQAMPRMTGIELARAIRAERPGIPIIMATGYAELPEGAASDMTRLSKPFTQRQLAEAVEQVIRPEATANAASLLRAGV